MCYVSQTCAHVWRDQKRALDPLEVQLQEAEGCPVWVGTENWSQVICRSIYCSSSSRGSNAFWAPSPGFMLYLNKKKLYKKKLTRNLINFPRIHSARNLKQSRDTLFLATILRSAEAPSCFPTAGLFGGDCLCSWAYNYWSIWTLPI